MALDISNAFCRVLHACLFHKLKSCGILGWIFGLISSFLSNVVSAGVPQDSILGSTFFLLYINDILDDVICNIAIYDDDTTLFFIHVIWMNRCNLGPRIFTNQFYLLIY